MSQRLEIARLIAWGVDCSDYELMSEDHRDEMLDGADAILEAGYRKMPTREELARALYVADNWGVEDAGKHWDDGMVPEWTIERMFRLADAILAPKMIPDRHRQ